MAQFAMEKREKCFTLTNVILPLLFNKQPKWGKCFRGTKKTVKPEPLKEKTR